MNHRQLQDLVQRRLDQAHETLREAQILLDGEAFRGAVNRTYYAMFYALSALLATKGIGTSKHSGALALFDREFVKPGLLSPDLSRSLRVAFARRQAHDYAEMDSPTREIGEQALADARAFVSALETYLRGLGYLGAGRDAPKDPPTNRE